MPLLPVTALLAVSSALALSGATRAGELTPAPVWEGTTLMGPARPAVELVKGTVTYDAETKKLTFKVGVNVVEMTRGSTAAEANGKPITLPVAPKVQNGATYVPLKNLYVGLGFEVKPSGENRWIICTKTQCIPLEVPPKPE